MTFKRYTKEQKVIAFWDKVAITANDNMCWLWKGTKEKTGYGQFFLDDRKGKRTMAHRIALSFPDYVIPDGMEICHSCDTPLCCNPKHLFIGTHQENMTDMALKERHPKGLMVPNGKLSDEQVQEIRYRYECENTTQAALASEYGIDPSLVSYIVNNKKRIVKGA